MEDDVSDIESKQTKPESTGESQGSSNLPLGHQGAAPQDEELIERLWAQGMSPDMIAHEIGKPVATVYRILKRIEQAIIRKDGIDEP
jgi:DNA invertase Pin-like site-specific DNA recombinase